MPDDITEIKVSLAQHEERIKRNTEDVEEACEDIEAIKVGNAGRDVKIDNLQWYILLITASIGAIAFAVLRQGIVR